MLTVDFEKFPVSSSDLVLDMGCGGGRHAFELYRRGANVIALDLNENELGDVAAMFAAMSQAGEVPQAARADTVRASAYNLPFADATFDKIVAAEILEHLPYDVRAMDELARVLKPGGMLAVSVPRNLPEKVCWMLSTEYHEVEGGHVRIYEASVLKSRLTATGLHFVGDHHAHSLHAPYWWLKCAVGVDNDSHPLVKGYHRLLVWDMMKAPKLTRVAERTLNPLIGKSYVAYLEKPKETTHVAA